MLTVTKLISRGQGLAPVLLKRAATVALNPELRQLSQFDATDSQGRQLRVSLPQGTSIRGGDVLVAEDGSLIVVHTDAAEDKAQAHTHEPPSRGKPIGIAIKAAAATPHVHGPGCKH